MPNLDVGTCPLATLASTTLYLGKILRYLRKFWKSSIPVWGIYLKFGQIHNYVHAQ